MLGYKRGTDSLSKDPVPPMLNVLSALECTQAKPKAANDSQLKPYKLFDGGGLFLLVNPNGSKRASLRPSASFALTGKTE